MSKYGKVGVKYTKLNAADVVTEADLASNNFLVSSIKKKFPDHGIISEETGEYKTQAEFVWYIDPLDGTRNYSVHTPLFCTMVGIVKNGEPYMGAIFDSVHNDFYFAKKDKGAFLNGKKIYCSSKKGLTGSWGSSSSRISEWSLFSDKSILKFVGDDSVWVNSYACTGINTMDVASGKHDWFVSSGGGGVWDYAAPSIILQESGCVLSDLAGKEWSINGKNGMIAANKILHKNILKAFGKSK